MDTAMQRLLDAMAQMEERLTDVLTGRGREQATHGRTSSFKDDSGADCILLNVGTDCTEEDDAPYSVTAAAEVDSLPNPDDCIEEFNVLDEDTASANAADDDSGAVHVHAPLNPDATSLLVIEFEYATSECVRTCVVDDVPVAHSALKVFDQMLSPGFDGEPIFDEDPNDPIIESIDVFGSSATPAYDDTFATSAYSTAFSPSYDDDLLGAFGIFVLDLEQPDGKQTAQPCFDSAPCTESDSEENRQSLLVVDHFLRHGDHDGDRVDRRLLRGRPTDRRAVAVRVDPGHHHHVQHGTGRGRDEQLLGMAEMGTIPVIFARRFKYRTPMFSIWQRCLWTSREVVPLPNRAGSIVDLHTEEASPGRTLVAEIRQICVIAKEIFLSQSQLTLLELEVLYEQEKLDGMVDTFQKDIYTNIS
jgi:hypothetical protein